MSLFDSLSRERLETMKAAAAEVQECYRVLEKTSANVECEVLAHQGTFYEWDHYPEGDVFDHETHSQHYYHSHRPEDGEHGHFHLFIRRDGIPDRMKIAPFADTEEWPTGDEIICHLVAISMDPKGYPLRLFTTNRWVTGENWYKAEDVIELLDRFKIDHTFPSWATNRWITAMVALYQPQIAQLLLERDKVIQAWSDSHEGDVLEDRDLEVTSKISLDMTHQIKQINKALKKLSA